MPVLKQGETKAETKSDPASYPLHWLEAMAERQAAAPVHRWNPPGCGKIDIVIDREGRWHHDGRPIARPALVRLFARILRREADGSYVLVTPVEKLAIQVEDVPFLAVDLDADPGPPPLLRVLTNLGEVVPLDAAHPLRIAAGAAGGFVPYVMVRPGLEARLTRSAAQSLAGLAREAAGCIGVDSAGQFFVIGPAPHASTPSAADRGSRA